MEDPATVPLEQTPDCARRFFRRTGATKFIDEQCHRSALFVRSAEFFIEGSITGWRLSYVRAGAYHRMQWIGQHDLFGGCLCFCIDGDWVHWIRFAVPPFSPVKNQI